MNILISSIIDLKKTSYSRLHYFIEHFIKSGHKVTVLSIKDNWKHKGLEQNQELTKQIKIKYITKKDYGAIRQKLSVPMIMDKLLPKEEMKQYDIHLSYSSLLLGYFVAKRAKKFGIDTIYDLADDLPEMISTSPHIPSYLKGIGGIVGKVMLEKNLKLAKVITITAKEFRKSMKISRFKHIVIPNGVNVKKFKPRKVSQKSFVIGYLGALREWVDLRPMLLAAKELSLEIKNLKVLVVGGEEDLPKYRKFVKKHDMEKLVTFTGNVPYDDVPKYVNKMDIATIPFKKNLVTDGTCPLKLLEYMAMKKACICSRLNEIKSMVGNKVLYADSVAEWKTSIKKLQNSPKLKERMGEAGRKHIEKNYDWNNLGEKMEKIIKKIGKN